MRFVRLLFLSLLIVTPASAWVVQHSITAGGGAAVCGGDTIVDADFAVGSTGGNIINHVATVGGAWTGTNADDGNLVWDTTDDWAEGDSGSDGIHKYAWLSDDMAFDVFSATITIDTTTGGTSTRAGVIIATPKPLTTLGWEGYRAHIGSGNFLFDRCADDGTCTNLITSAQSNSGGTRTITVTRTSSGVWSLYAVGTSRGAVTDTTYGITRFGMYLRNLGRFKSIVGTCN